MSVIPDTPVWRELRRLAAADGLEEIALRHARPRPAGSCFADLTWRGGERETVLLWHTDDPDELARALARELGLALGTLQPGALRRGTPAA